MKSIGLVGAGNMGYYFGLNLMKKGYSLTVFDIKSGAMKRLKEKGASVARSPMDVAERSDIILTSLPSSPNVRSAVIGKDGIVEGMGRRKALIEMSSIDPYAMVEVAKEVEARGGDVLDAPVSGVPAVARKGQLVIMVGGKRAVARKCMDVLGVLGTRVMYVGPIGYGKIAKLANNTLTTLNGIAVCEVVNWVIQSGLDLGKFYSVVRETNAYSRRLEYIVPKILKKESLRGSVFNLKKDLTLALETASHNGVAMPMTSLATQFLQSAISLNLTSSGIVKIFQAMSGRGIRIASPVMNI
jgi:3-hydroxyisobutyrate dehydrogenase-like beta-hydroxyacid dehydrogenase